MTDSGKPPEKNPWVHKGRRVVFDNPWMEIRKDRVIRPDGSVGPYAYVHYRHLAVGILPVLDNEDVLLVGQWRYTLNQYSWEIPAGGCKVEEGEAPLDTAHRELAEETGMQAGRMLLLGTGHLSNSITDEVSHVYLAQDLSPASEQHQPDPTEDLQVRRVSFPQLLDMIHRDEITDALSLTAVLKYQLLLERG